MVCPFRRACRIQREEARWSGRWPPCHRHMVHLALSFLLFSVRAPSIVSPFHIIFMIKQIIRGRNGSADSSCRGRLSFMMRLDRNHISYHQSRISESLHCAARSPSLESCCEDWYYRPLLSDSWRANWHFSRFRLWHLFTFISSTYGCQIITLPPRIRPGSAKGGRL